MSRTAPPTSIELVADRLLLEVLTAGASVRRLVLTDETGTATNVVLGHADPVRYVSDGGFLGATIGRFGNRIAKGRFVLDGEEHRLSTNEGSSTLHGGAEGFDRRAWRVVDRHDDRVTLALTSPHGDQGFPGTLDVAVTYSVAPGRVQIDYEATTDRPTVVNLTNHAYFNLDGEGSGPVDAHVLTLEADAFTPVDADLVPTGEIRPVQGTPFDWRTGRGIGDALASDDEQLRHGRGFDHNFVVRGSGLRAAATLRSPSGRSLVVESDQPAIQVYTGAHFDGTFTGPSGDRYDARAGIALETQGFPDAPNQPSFPSTVLRPGEVHRTTTVWRLGR